MLAVVIRDRVLEPPLVAGDVTERVEERQDDLAMDIAGHRQFTDFAGGFQLA
jgi:hypothetical protein